MADYQFRGQILHEENYVAIHNFDCLMLFDNDGNFVIRSRSDTTFQISLKGQRPYRMQLEVFLTFTLKFKTINLDFFLEIKKYGYIRHSRSIYLELVCRYGNQWRRVHFYNTKVQNGIPR